MSNLKHNAAFTGAWSRHAARLVAGCMLAAAGACAMAHEGQLSATAELVPKSGSSVTGEVHFVQMPRGTVRVAGIVEGLTPGKHGFHIHTNGNCDSPDAMSAAGHFNPYGTRHGSPLSREHHPGDLGNIEAGTDGRAEISMEVEGVTVALMGTQSIVGRSVIVHAGPDDFSDPAGNSGARVACGHIEQDMMGM